MVLFPAHAMMNIGGTQLQRHLSLTSTLVGGAWLNSGHDRFYQYGKDHQNLLNRRLEWLQKRSGGLGEKKIHCPCRDSNPGTPIRQPNRYTSYTNLGS